MSVGAAQRCHKQRELHRTKVGGGGGGGWVMSPPQNKSMHGETLYNACITWKHHPSEAGHCPEAHGRLKARSVRGRRGRGREFSIGDNVGGAFSFAIGRSHHQPLASFVHLPPHCATAPTTMCGGAVLHQRCKRSANDRKHAHEEAPTPSVDGTRRGRPLQTDPTWGGDGEREMGASEGICNARAITVEDFVELSRWRVDDKI